MNEGCVDLCEVSLADSRFDYQLWDDEAVVYVLDTGATHELSAAAAAVLATLAEAPARSMNEVALLAALSFDDDADGDRVAVHASPRLQQLRELLGHMQTMGIVERRAARFPA